MNQHIKLVAMMGLAASTFFSCAPQQTGVSPEVLEVQLIPSRDAEYLDSQRAPLQTLLETELGMKVNVTVATDYNALIEAMASKQVHVGLLATTAYVLAADDQDGPIAEAILKSLRYDVDDNGNQLTDMPLVSGYKSQLLTLAGKGITSVADLKGKKIAIASFTSTSGFVWPANLLADNGLNPETDVEWVNAGGHDKAVQALYNGEVDAAFTFKDARTLFKAESFFADLMTKVVLVTNTTDIPNDTVSVIPDLNPELKEKVRLAFMNIMKKPEGLEIMRKIYSHEGYAPALDSDYAQVREYLKRKDTWNF